MSASEWVSSPFWSMFFGPQSLYSSYVKCTSIFSDVSGVFAIGSTDSLFDGPKFKSRVLAVRLSLVMIFNLMILYIIITWSYSLLNILAIMFPVSGLLLSLLLCLVGNNLCLEVSLFLA